MWRFLLYNGKKSVNYRAFLSIIPMDKSERVHLKPEGFVLLIFSLLHK